MCLDPYVEHDHTNEDAQIVGMVIVNVRRSNLTYMLSENPEKHQGGDFIFGR